MIKRLDFKITEPNGPLVGLVSLALIGMVVGLMSGWLWSRIEIEGIREDDYFVMVSLLYERDRSLPNALERLAILESDAAAQSIASLAESYPKAHPEAQVESRALRQLAGALNKPSAETASQKVAPDRSSGGESGGPWLWLGVALVFVCFLGIGGPFALRFLHSTNGRFGRPWSRGSRRGSILRDARSLKRPTLSMGPARTMRRAPQKTVEEPTATQNGEIEHSPLKPLPELHFVSHYQYGEETYDEIHPVYDRISGALIGACGFSAELKLSENHPENFYAFSVWAHDHAAGGRLKSIGIISKWAKSKSPPTLVRWVETGKADQVVVANPGMRVLIDTGALAVDVNITGFRYGTEPNAPPESYFSSLSVSFDVRVKDLAEI